MLMLIASYRIQLQFNSMRFKQKNEDNDNVFHRDHKNYKFSPFFQLQLINFSPILIAVNKVTSAAGRRH